jgi:tripartite-type tricarboxylate transporter receptor subunit TctC
MRALLAQTIIIETVAGASGSLGTGRVARAAPDGYTFIVGNVGTQVTNGAVYELKYDVLSDFEPVSLVATQPFLIVAKKAMPADDLKGRPPARCHPGARNEGARARGHPRSQRPSRSGGVGVCWERRAKATGRPKAAGSRPTSRSCPSC